MVSLNLEVKWCATLFQGLVLVWTIQLNVIAAQEVHVSPVLQIAIEDALVEKNTDLRQRFKLVAEVNQLFGSSPSRFRNEHWLKAQFIDAVALMRQNEFDRSLQQIRDLQQHVNDKDFPELSFRCRSLSAAIGLLQGKRTESIKAFEELLAGDLDGIPSFLIDRARTNYAVALNENGRAQEAMDVYESLLLAAIEHQKDPAALHAGNNLLSILLDQNEVPAAKLLLAELEPIRVRNSKTIGAQSILLHQADLLRLEDKSELAIAALQDFIDQANATTPDLQGAAHQLLATTYRQTGNLEKALYHAEQSVALTKPVALEIAGALLTLANIQLLNHDPRAALRTLDSIDASSLQLPMRQIPVSQLKLEAQLRIEGKNQEADQLRLILDAQEQYNQLRSKSIAEYFSSKLSAVHERMGKQITEEQARSKSETYRLTQFSRNLLLCLFAALVASAVIVRYLDSSRRRERVRLEEKESQNDQLTAMVEQKTQELKSNLQAQAELAQALERKKRVETVGLLASNVAHDINNLLQVIANANENLASRDINEQDRQSVLRISNDSLKHGAGIIRQLLAYSRQQELTAQPVHIHDYLSESRALFRSALGDGIELDINLGKEDCCIHVDAAQLTTSILNILSNSADAMPSGGKVTIQSSVITITEKEIANSQNLEHGKYLQLRIVDTGLGMGESQRVRAFEPFYSTKATGKGTGLGLSSVHGFVRQSKGEVELISSLGAGTEIKILLPVAAVQETKPQLSSSMAAASLDHRRILLVEDHKALATSLMTLLSHLKLKATWVPSGEAAIKLLENEYNFDFVLSDVHMPGSVDGLSLAKWIELERPQIKTLLMSGYHEIPFEEFKRPILPKPFNLRQLTAFLTEHSI